MLTSPMVFFIIIIVISYNSFQIMSGEKGIGGGDTTGGGKKVDVPILGLLQTESESRDYTNDTNTKLPRVCFL